MIRDMFTGEERPAAGSPPETIGEAEFVERYTERLVFLAGEVDSAGGSNRTYAASVAPTCFDDPARRLDGPETCAEVDLGYWETA